MSDFSHEVPLSEILQFVCNYKKLNFERVAESGDELYDVSNSAAY